MTAVPAERLAIPLPPRDPALPGLETALEGDAMAELLTRRLPDCTSGRYELESCSPRYIRYKPRTNCLVQYELTLRGEGGSISTLAHAKLFADRQQAVRIWDRPLHRLVEEAGRLLGPPAARAALVPELQALVEVFPVDRKLRGLVRAISARETRGILAAALRGVEVVRYKPARKAVLRYHLNDPTPVTVYGKLYADGRGAALLDAGRALIAAGVASPWPLAYLPELQLLVFEEARGIRLGDLRDDRAFDGWLAPVAQALAHLHRTRIDGLPAATPQNEAREVLEAARMLATLVPGSGDRAVRLAEAVSARLVDVRNACVPIHGDFYDDQVLTGEDGVVLLDFDRARMGDPLVDMAGFAARLTARGAEDSRQLFLEAHASASGEVDGRVPLFETAALLRLAVEPFRRLEPAWPGELARLVELAAARFEEFRGPVPRVDSSLPQLERLQDRGRVARELEGLLGAGPVDVTGATVVRHKPGRRCLLRYDVTVGLDGSRRGECFYGKTYASDRGEQVHAKLQALAVARACGPDVAIPDPIGYVPSLKLVLQRAISGNSIRPALLAGGVLLADRIAEALHALHNSGVGLDGTHLIGDELDPLARRVERLGVLSPSLLPAAERCLALVEERRDAWSWRLRPVHRDFYHDQLVAREGRLAVLDFDDAKMSEPAIDVANFVAHLRLLGLQERSDAAALAPAAEAFGACYRRLDPDLDPALVRFLEGATLLRLAEIHLPRERGEWVAKRLLVESERLLTA